MSNIEYATLFLTTAAGEYNDEYHLSCSWNNINLRTVLGPMYDKYDVFVIRLAFVGQGSAPEALGTSVNDNLVIIELLGLPLINNTYNVNTNHNTNATIIGLFEILLENISYTIFSNSPNLTFGKNSEQVNITINLLNVSLSPPSAVTEYPVMCYSFNIYGIPKEKGDLNNTRMAR